MALFASFGQLQSFTENSSIPSCDNPERFCELNQSTFNYLNSHTMKRKRVPDEPDQPGAKKRHYEERMVNRLNSLDLGSEARAQGGESSEDELCIREIDPEYLTESPVNFDSDEDSTQPIVEEPEDDESENFVLSDELRQIMNAAKEKKLLHDLLPNATGRELVVWRPPRLGYSSSDDSIDTSTINSRIKEVIEEDVEFTDLSNGIESSTMEGSGEITFPEESSSSRSSASPPLNILNSSSDGRTGCQSSSSTSSSEENLLFRLRQTSGSNPVPEACQSTGEEPMDLD